MTNKLFIGAITVATAASLFACGAPSQTSAPATDNALAPEAAFVGDRHVLATGETLNFEQIRAQLPQQISLADAERMLETVDPSRLVADDGNYSVQQPYRRGSYRRGGHAFFFNRRHNFRFFRHRNILFPFHRIGSFYRPYTFATYSPFLYSYRNFCYPYSYHY